LGLKIFRLGGAEFRGSLWSGEGGLHVDGRWHVAGRRVVYAAQSLSLAQLEVLVHISDRRQMPRLVYGEADFPDSLSIEAIKIAGLPDEWRRFAPYHAETQRIGTDWLKRQSSAVLQVPSAISADEWNFLLNPAHPEFSGIQLGTPRPFEMDPRVP
jgi:RES domain-containing protein